MKHQLLPRKACQVNISIIDTFYMPKTRKVKDHNGTPKSSHDQVTSQLVIVLPAISILPFAITTNLAAREILQRNAQSSFCDLFLI
jgi:hypothetical protein